MIQDDSPLEEAENGMALFIDTQQQPSSRMKCDACDIRPVCEWKCVRCVVYEIEDSYSVANGREETCSVGCVDQIPFSINCS